MSNVGPKYDLSELEKKPAALVEIMGRQARQAAAALAELRPETKNRALLRMANALEAAQVELIEANQKDLEAGRAAGLSPAMLDRLEITPKRLEAMSDAICQVAALEDPVGEIFDMTVRPNGLWVGRMRVPIGVIGIIYESRPNVTADAAALCVKSGNAVILRGGSEAIHSNRKIAQVLAEAGAEAGLPPSCIQLIPTTDRAAVGALLKATRNVDLIIPRGGKSLIERVVEESHIPVIKHYDGNCMIFVDATAEIGPAIEIVINSKCQRPGVCNALETLVVHSGIARDFLGRALPALAEKGVDLRGDERACAIRPDLVKPATEDDWSTEYLALILAVKVVDSLDEAIEFINTYGSHHTEAILTRDHSSAMRFLRAVDSACVHINCSTRFSDGGEYGLGAEIGISTDKLHARGPMGLKELTSAKFIVFGQGQIRG
jgi:glutamate-5-semialdehyde dehydrogenase